MSAVDARLWDGLVEHDHCLGVDGGSFICIFDIEVSISTVSGGNLKITFDTEHWSGIAWAIQESQPFNVPFANPSLPGYVHFTKAVTFGSISTPNHPIQRIRCTAQGDGAGTGFVGIRGVTLIGINPWGDSSLSNGVRTWGHSHGTPASWYPVCDFTPTKGGNTFTFDYPVEVPLGSEYEPQIYAGRGVYLEATPPTGWPAGGQQMGMCIMGMTVVRDNV